MITPDGTDPPGSPPRRRRPAVLVGIAALVVFAGLMILGTLTAPNPAAVEETTTTTTVDEVEPPIDPENFTVSQIATGDPLDWDLSMAIDDGYPLELLEHEDDLYLFTGQDQLTGPDSAGLTAWRSSNGTNWEPLGEVISTDHRITTIDSTVQGLVATAIRREDGALMLWESADAVEWTGSEIPTGSEGPYHLDVASAVGASETVLVVASNPRYDRERLLKDRLSAMGIELDLGDLVWNLRWLGEEGHHLLVTGPFGIPVLETPIDALGLNNEERQELTNELFDPVGTDVRVRSGSGEWETGFIGDTRVIDSILATPDDRLIAYGTGTSGRLAKATHDGIEWSPAASSVSPLQAQKWKQRLVGAVNSPDVMISGDGETWTSTGLSDRFPDELPWAPITLGAGEGGVAMFVRGDGRRSPVQPRSLELTAPGGSPFLLVQQGGEFVVISEDGRNRWVLNDRSSTEPDESIDVDIEEKRLTLRHAESGQIWVSFSFENLQRAEREYSRDLMRSVQPWHVIAFTRDGEEWVIQDMAPEIGDHTTIWLLEVTEDRIVAVVRNTLDTLIRGGAPGLEIWSASIP